MPACSDPPNRAPREVIDRLIDAVAWAKTCMIVTAATAPTSADRNRELAALREATTAARRDADAVIDEGQALPYAVVVELRACELAIPRLEAGAVLRRAP